MSFISEEHAGACTLMPSPYNRNIQNYEGVIVNKDIAIKIPKTLDLRAYMQPVRNQGGRGTCLAFALSACKEYQERIDNKIFNEYMSPESVYFYRMNKPNSGMFAHDGLEILLKHGICREEYLPYNGSIEPKDIPEKAKEEMPNYVIKSYAKINTIEGVKRALVESGPLLICIPVYNNGTPQLWKQTDPTQKLVGGHAMTIVGFTQEGFIIRNSWGPVWNKDGHVVFPFSDFGCQWEIWTSVDAETTYIPPHLNPDSPDYVTPPHKFSFLCCK